MRLSTNLFFLVLCHYAFNAYAENQSSEVSGNSKSNTSAGEDSREAPVEPADPKPKKAKNRRKLKKVTPASTVDASASDEGAKSAFLPPWPTASFDWTVSPSMQVAYGSNEDASGTTKSVTSEVGVHGGLSHITIIPNNPGVAVGADLGYGMGVVNATRELDGETTKSTTHYKRTIGGLHLTAYYGWLKEQIDFSQGRITYDDADKTVVQSTHLRHDLGVLIVSWISTHYTFGYLRGYGKDYQVPLLTQYDHWLHGRAFTSLMHAYIDFGPGYTTATEYSFDQDKDTNSEVAKGSVNYLRLLAGANPFWKLVCDVQAKYFIHASSESLGSLAKTRLPEQSVNEQTPATALPEDSVTATIFTGLRQVVSGLDVGWQTNLAIVNAASDRERSTTRTAGPVIGFSAQF